MQHGSLAVVSRKEGPAVWQFRWSEKDLHGARVQRKRVIGSVERHPNEAAGRRGCLLRMSRRRVAIRSP
jgi:integrase